MAGTDDVTQLARRFRVQINMGTAGSPSWQTLLGVEEIKPTFELRREDDETTEDDGAARQAVTGHKWSLDLKIKHRTDSTGAALNTVQEAVRTAGEATETADNEVHVRWFDRNGLSEAYEGYALVDWKPAGGNPAAQDVVDVTLHGQGPRTAITNPA